MEDESSSDPPFEIDYKNLLDNQNPRMVCVGGEVELPLIDLSELDLERDKCRREIAKASQDWGFFQVINHGIPMEVLQSLREEQMKLMKKPFLEKTRYKDLNFSQGCYRWGTPFATTLDQLSWSEAFHVSLNDVLGKHGGRGGGGLNSTLGSAMERFVGGAHELSQTLAGLLSEETGLRREFIQQTCVPATSYLRLNRYPACPKYPHMQGISPHTDSDFFTILHQDTIGGLQLMKDGNWIAVKPRPDALVINIGDLFQAWSNNVYTSVLHRVMANAEKERFSTAYFFCPSDETVIESNVYRSFSFREFRNQVSQDVKVLGCKIGLPNFLLS